MTLWLVVTGCIGLYGMNLECRFHKLRFDYGNINEDGCNARNVNVTSRDQTFESVNGQNLSVFNASSYKIIQMNDQTVNFVPQGLGKIFPNIIVLCVVDSSLQEIRKESISQFPKISHLYLKKNKLQYLPVDLFEGTLDLKYILLQENDIKYVSHEALTPLTKLIVTVFKPNPCINVDFNKLIEPSQITETLRTNCSHNTLDIQCEFDSTTKHCKVLNLTVEIPASVIKNIVTIDDGKMSQSSGLIEKLLIFKQNVQFLPSNLAEKLPNLTEITIEKSKLLEITQESFTNLKLLTSIKIVGNNLRTISEHSFDDNVNLQKLNLTSNRIKAIANNTFSSLINLEVLDLSHNRLTSVDTVNFAVLVSMQVLKLNDNKLRDLKSGLFDFCSELLHLDISCK